MRSILWFQSNDALSQDFIIADGELLESTTNREGAFLMLKQANSELAMSPELRKKFHSKFPEMALQANYAFPKEGGIYIQGCYKNLDESGRKIAYMFYTKNANTIEEACEELQAISAKFDKTCSEKELSVIKLHVNETSKSKAKKKVLLAVCFIALIVVILIIIKLVG